MTDGSPEARPPWARLLDGHLPHGLRVVALEPRGAVSTAVLGAEDGRRWGLDWWLGHPELATFRAGERLRWAYRGDGEAPPVGEVAAVLDALASVEAELAALGPVPKWPVAARRSGRVLFLDESGLSVAVARLLPRAGSLEAAIEALLDREVARGPELEQIHLYLQAPCGQACEFCAEPEVRRRPLGRLVALGLRAQARLELDPISAGAIEAILGWIGRRDPRIVFQLTGHDWLRHRHRDRILASLAASSGPVIRLQGPSTSIDDSLARRIAAIPGLDLVTTTLQSSDAALHDAMVGLPGAHGALLGAIDALRRAGVRVRAAVVLTRRALPTLASTVELCAARGVEAQLQAFVPDREMRGGAEALAPLGEIRAALATVPAGARPSIGAIVGVPPCAVPEALADRALPAAEGHRRDRAAWGARCASCRERPRCAGLPARQLAAFGEDDLRPL